MMSALLVVPGPFFVRFAPDGMGKGLKPIFGQNTDISSIMPDTVMNEKPLDTLKALTVAVVTGIIFLLPAIRIFDKKDVK